MKRKILSMLLVVLLCAEALSMAPGMSRAYDVPANMEWWSQDRFGMFIHLGSYSLYGQGEWAMSEQKISKQEYQTTVSAKFNPVNFNAQEIAGYARAAGMKYLVITAKHHEGLSMWDTQVASFKDYTGTKMFSLQQYTPFGETGRDLLMELKNACDEAGLKFGLYYSIIDWNHSSQSMGDNFTKMESMEARESYIKDMKAQLQELVAKYNPAVMWFDGDWTGNKGKATLESWWTKKDGKELYDYLKGLNPDIIVNERVCRGFGLGDFDCPEQSVPNEALDRPWETCQTMNDAWGYKKTSEKKYRSVRAVIQELATVASREGNYLLNVGPKGDGTLTAGSVKILKGLEKWMSVYGDSIYGTVRNPFPKEPSWGTYTRKGNTVYAHVFQWPKNRTLKLPKYKKKKVKTAYLMGKPGKKLKVTVQNGKCMVQVPKKPSDKRDEVVVLEYAHKK